MLLSCFRSYRRFSQLLQPLSIAAFLVPIHWLNAAPLDFIEQPLIAGPNVSSAQDFLPIDVDNDGDLDIVTVTTLTGEVFLLQNLGNGFAPPAVIAETPAPRALATADLNGDGLLDVIFTETQQDLVVGLINQGAGNFAAPVTISNVGDQQPDVATADFDNDGDPDIVYISFADDALRYVENLGGTFAVPLDISTTIDGPQSLAVGDLNGDGNIDVYATSGFDSTLAWFAGNGDGTFGVAQVISSTVSAPRDALLADLDADGDLDALSFSQSGRAVVYFLNTGNGTFAAEQRIQLTTADNIRQIQVADFDADGDIDIALANDTSIDEIVWYPNNGSAVFGAEQSIVPNLSTAFRFAVADITGSSLPDVVFLDGFSVVKLSENQAGTFAPPIRVTNGVANPLAIFAGDADSDSDPDLFAIGRNENTVFYFSNTGGAFAPATIVAEGIPFLSDIIAADFDNDGDLDPITADAADDSVSLYPQTALGVFGPRQQITTLADAAADLAVGDLDGDGDIDIISSSISDDKIAWYSNLGGLTFGAQQIISTTGDSPRDVEAFDVDGDGDVDVLAVSAIDDELNLYENLGSGSFAAGDRVATNLDNPRALAIGDIDNDGMPDIVVASDARIGWFRNTSNASQIDFAIQDIFVSSVDGFFPFIDMKLGDIDDDGDLDVAATAISNRQFVWFENDGSGSFSSAQPINNWRGDTLAFADVDSDGRSDIVATDRDRDVVGWFRSDLQRDFGDALDPSYPTLRATDGARHEVSTLFLGSVIDSEADGQPTIGVDGDDTDAAQNDDDGVTFDGLVQEGIGSIDVIVSQPNVGIVNTFIDFNADGDFDDNGEHAIVSELVDTASETILFAVPPGTAVGDKVARVRLTSLASEGEIPDGQANDGEVEDYLITISQATLSIGDATVSEGDSGNTIMDFPITISDPLAELLSYSIALTPVTADANDVTGPSASLIFPPGSTVSQAQVLVSGDTDFEPDETFTATLTSPGNVVIGNATATGTIVNDDVRPSVDLSASPSGFAENGGTSTITATLSARSFETITIDLSYAGDAVNAVDYSASATQITITPGQLTGSVVLTGIDDNAIEGNEAVDVSIANFTNVSAGTTTDLAINVIDDEIPEATLAYSGGAIDENAGTATVTATLSFATTQPVTLTLGFAGDASAADYNVNNTQVSFAANATTASVVITAIDDTIFEGTETLQLNITSAANASVGVANQVVVDITDDDPQPAVSLSSSASSVAENAGSVDIIATLANSSSQPVVIDLAFAGSALANVDYQPSATQITIAAGDLSGTLQLSGLQDTIFETAETIDASIASVTGGNAGAASMVSIELTDDDTQPSVSLTQIGSPIVENAGSATLTATLSNATTQPVTVDLTFSGAANVADYSVSAIQLTIPAGQLTADVVLTAIDDNVFEGDETVIVNIGGAVNASVGTTASQTLLIVDDESLPIATIQADAVSATEGNAFAVTVSLDNASTEAVVAMLGITGTVDNSDFLIGATSVNIAPGLTSATVTVTVTDDTIFEGNENIIVSIDSVTNAAVGGVASANVNIIENDSMPAVAIVAMPAVVTEAGGMTNVVVTLSNASVQDVTVDVSLTGTSVGQDYSAAANVVVVLAGTLNASLPITAIDDEVFEGDETIVATITNVTNGTAGNTATATITITDDESVPVASLSAAAASVDENAGTDTVTVTLSNASTQTVTLDLGFAGTASAGDFTASTTQLVIAPGNTSANFVITGVDDTLIEGGETISISIASAVNASVGDGVDIEIIDDEAPSITLTLDEARIGENRGTATLTATLSFTSPQNITFDIATAGSADSSDYQISATQLNIAAGDTTAMLTIDTLNDANFEGDETVAFTVAAAVNASAATSTPVILTIVDDELPPPPGLTLTGSLDMIPENGGVSVITAAIDAPFPLDITVPLLYRGGAKAADFDMAERIVIPAGMTTASINLTALDDFIDEADETLVVFPGGFVNARLSTPNSVEIRIIDDELTNAGDPPVDTSEALTDRSVDVGFARVPVTTFGLRNPGSTAATVRRITLGVALSALSPADVGLLTVYEDLNGDGIVQPGEPVIGLGALIDLGVTVDFALETPITLAVGQTRRFVALANQ